MPLPSAPRATPPPAPAASALVVLGLACTVIALSLTEAGPLARYGMHVLAIALLVAAARRPPGPPRATNPPRP